MSEDLYRTIAEQSPNANFVFDLDAKQLVYVNHAFKVLTGVDNENLSAPAMLKLVHPEDREHLISNFRQLLDGVNKPTIEFRLQMNGNDEKWIRLTPFLFSPDSGKSIVAYASDVTADLHNLHTMKKYANKKNSVLSILSHDLRGPLGIANNVTQVLNRKVEDPQLVELIKTVSKILSQCIDLIGDLTGREFLETTGVELVKQRINIAVKLKEYMEEAQKSVALTKRTFNFSSSDESIFINLDESKFMQIINNLITNSLKFTKDDGIISLSVKEQHYSVLFTFSDNGIGIPKQFHASIFDKFTEARRKGLKGEPTVGLGLSIVKLIVEWHKGKIWFESEEGQGSTFYIEIPKG
jgi:two-component system, OmpR family, sensor histidine kinase VicK